MSACVVAALSVVALLESCSGGCSRRSDDATGGNARLTAEPNEILSHPVSFDAQSVSEAARLVMSGRPLTTVETAEVIVVAESAVNHLGQELESLTRSDDDADIWNVMTELSEKSWPVELLQIVGGLSGRDLDGVERERITELEGAIGYSRDLIRGLHARNRRFPEFFMDGSSWDGMK